MIETAPRPAIRTIVASFVFTDLVGFSKGTASDQFAAKARLSSVLRSNLAALRESDYWIKDTGDGALIAFVSNPEHALYMALALAHEYPAAPDAPPSSSLRTGLHLGTVKESIDVEARRNFIGDGINAAKRIMDFAHPGQIAASRAFFEAIANLDAAYAALFQHLGAPDDKHGRAHDLYALAPSESVLERLRADLAADRASAAETSAPKPDAATGETATGSAAQKTRRGFVVAGGAALLLTALFVTLRGREPLPQPGIPAEPARSSTNQSRPNGDNGSAPKESAPAVPPREAPPAQETAASAKPATESSPMPSKAPTPPRAPGAAAPARTADTKVKAPAPGAGSTDVHGASGPSSPRCSRILEKAALGEPLAPEEKRELANTCR